MRKPSDDRTNQKSPTFSNINMTNLPTNIKRGDKEGCEKKDENCQKENVAPVGHDTNDLGSPTFNIDQPQFKIRQPDVESDAESSTSDHEEDEYIAKGPVFPTKQNKQLRENTPFDYCHENNCRNHYSGGQIIFEFDQGYAGDNIQGPNFTKEQNDDLNFLVEMINKTTNMLPPDERERLDSAISNVLTEGVMLNHEQHDLQHPVETFDTIFSQERDINTTRSSMDEDSAYETSSPHSSVSNSPMPNVLLAEASPHYDPQFTLNIPGIPDFTDPRGPNQCHSTYKVSPRQIESRHEKTQPLNIQPCTRFNIPSSSLNMPSPSLNIPSPSLNIPSPSFNIPSPSLNIPSPSLNIPSNTIIQRRPSIAPALTVVVHEEKMKESARSRVQKILNNRILVSQWTLALNDAKFFQLNNDGNTKLIAHLKSPVDSKHFFEVFEAQMSKLIHGLKNDEVDECLSFLRYTNQKNENALSIAIKDYADRPLVARYILETLFVLYENDIVKARAAEPLLLHRLIKEGDKLAHILAECLNMSLSNNPTKRCFDVNEKDINGLTPLLLAASLHLSPNKEPNFSTLAITKLLVNHGASVTIGDLFGLTPIDFVVKDSCDPQMLKTLLSHNDVIERKAIDLEDQMKNTALHIAAKRCDVPIEVQANVMKQLKDSGWSMTKSNIENKTPQSLLPEDRKKWILEYIQRKK